MQASLQPTLIRALVILAALSILLIATYFPYSAALERERAHLAMIAKHAAERIAPLAGVADSSSAGDDALAQEVRSTLQAIAPRGPSGELTLGRRTADGKVVFVFRQGAEWPDEPLVVAADAQRGVVMARGLLGGHLAPQGPDYRGEEVFAAFRPVPGSSFGIIAKLAVSEIQAPFVRALGGSAAAALALLWLGVWAVQGATARQLRTRQAYLQSVIDAVPQRVLTLNRNGEVIDCNDPRDKPGSPGGEALRAGDRLVAALDEKVRGDIQALLDAAIEGRGCSTTCSAGCPGGTRWFSIQVVPFQAMMDGPPGALVTIDDITARQRSAERLKDYARHLERLFHSDPDAVLLFDPISQRVIEVNSHAERLFERRREQLLRLTLPELSAELQPYGLDLSSAADLLAYGSQEVTKLEWRFRGVTGREFPCAMRLVPMPSEQGTQVYCRLIDISSRKQTEEWLHVQSRALEAAANGVIITEANIRPQRIVYINQAFERITGYTSDDVIDQSLAILLSEGSRQSGVQELYSAIRAGEEAKVVVRSRRRDGTPFWNEIYIAPVRDPEGRLTHYIGVINDATARIDHEQRLAYQAHHDGLTALPNRLALSEHLAQEIERAEASTELLGVLFIDLDNFKLVNDSRDHEYGDRLLKTVGERLARLESGSRFLARYGGDEFVITLPALESELELEEAARDILSVLSETFRIDDLEVVLTCSIGTSLYPRDGRSAPTLLRNASSATHRAKELGRNQIQPYTSFLARRASERLTMERELRHAIGNGEIFVMYQPKIALGSGRISGFEALVRWEHPTHGRMSPAKFIPLAEESGLILPLGELVLLEAAIQLKQWTAAGFDTSIAVNVSARQLDQPAFPSHVAALLQEIGVEPARIELELTEGNVMRQEDAMLPTLQRLKRFGVRLALDDFGTGYSSLAHLREFPFDCLKIDRCFTNNISQSAEDGAIVTAIMTMARQLGLSIVAEGVETLEQARHLRQHGCEYGQGYYWSRPLPAGEATALLMQGARGWDQPRSATGEVDV